MDDEPTVLALVRTMLWRAGYSVLEASCGEEALNVAANHQAPIHILLADVLMPDLNGFQVAEKVLAVSPDTKVLYMSGYRDKVLVESTGGPVSQSPLIRKPFTQHTLLAKIEEILDGSVVRKDG